MTWKTSLKKAAQTKHPLQNEKADILFKTKIPPHFLANIDPNNPHDPLLKQVLPLSAETKTVTGYSHDPLAEAAANPIPGLLHKYHGRVLLIASTTCAIHCRYCFRRSFPYEQNNPGRKDWQKALNYIRQDTSIQEVILSGGDPLTLTDTSLQFLITQLNDIPHLTTLRFHTRIPNVMPERITPDLLKILDQIRLKRVMVIHANHPNEIDSTVKATLAKLKNTGFVLLNQAVLLKDVNDNADTLIQLSKTLFDANVLPYYLHMLDKVNGTAHFEVDLKTAKKLMKEIRAKLPGYLVPQLVQEEPGEPNKTLV